MMYQFLVKFALVYLSSRQNIRQIFKGKMKNLICALAYLLFSTSAFSQSAYRHRDAKQIDVNQIKTFLSNLGTLGVFTNIATWDQLRYRDYLSGNELNNTGIVYQQGLWMLGKINGENHASVTEWNTHFLRVLLLMVSLQ